MIELRGVRFTDAVTNETRHTVEDWGLVMSKKVMGTPKLKYKGVTIPDRDGDLDFTDALYGVPLYDNRILDFVFEYLNDPSDWTEAFNDIRNFLHGRKMKIFDPDDGGDYYYTGRVEVGDPSGGIVEIFEVKASANPWKLKTGGATVVTKAISQGNFVIENDWKPVVPTLTVTDAVSLTYRGVTYSMTGSGTFTFPKMLLQHGDNAFVVVSGSGTVTFTFQEGAI